jgi:hypothetical protein
LTFAAGSADSLTIEVRWRDGTTTTVPGARPNRLYEIEQGPPSPSSPASASSPSSPPPSLFTPAPLTHRHHEPGFDDAARQALLPNAFSQLGPGVSWYDIDRDGDEDLLLGSGRGGRMGIYRNDGGRFVPIPHDFDVPGDLTTILALPSPGTAGGITLIAGLSSYEIDNPAHALEVPSVISVPLDLRGRPVGEPLAAVAGDTASVGPLALADYDGDGDLDLFVGARILPGAYPLSPSSRLYRNDGSGRFALDQGNSALLRNLGMISAAVFTDLDGDGDPDLALTTEWGPLKLFLNQNGQFSPAPDSWTSSLAPFYSRWFGLAAGDFDGDGRMDLVATSWGRNIRPSADSTRPLYLYFGNFDDNGSLDLLLAQDDPRLGGPAPVTSFARLSRAVPDIAQRLRTFNAFADATVETVLGPAAANAIRLGATTFDHLVLLNRGDHFEARPLPIEAQFAPAIAPVVADFDGDGLEDLVLSQNFFPTDIGTPRYDAGRALLLRGDGKGGFIAVPGQESGLMVYGDQRGAATADFDRDGRPDLVITQNGTATLLFRNQGARPGLRVRLEGSPGNPSAIGASIRLQSATGEWGPRREIAGGTGYLSTNGAVQVLGLPGEGQGELLLEVTWPSGTRTTHRIPPSSREIAISSER